MEIHSDPYYRSCRIWVSHIIANHEMNSENYGEPSQLANTWYAFECCYALAEISQCVDYGLSELS